ncbi:MAG: hypothetical protein M3123_05560 [Actinomycetota bacterium]|nr:hypothetical protein [Actinomycetota bacterium]
MARRRDERKRPARLEPALPDEVQTSVHAQPVNPEPAASDAPESAVERTLDEEAKRRTASAEEGSRTEGRRDER